MENEQCLCLRADCSFSIFHPHIFLFTGENWRLQKMDNGEWLCLRASQSFSIIHFFMLRKGLRSCAEIICTECAG